MKIRKGQIKRIKCYNCKQVKNAKLIHVKRSYWTRGDIEVNTFILQYRIGIHRIGKHRCIGSLKIDEREFEGLVRSTF